MPSSSQAVERPQARAYNQSRVKLFLRCRRAYFYRYDYPVVKLNHSAGVELVPTRTKLPLRKGTWCHALLEAHWRGDDWRQVHKQLTTEFTNLFQEEQDYYGDLPDECERLFKGYLRRYRDDDEKFSVVKLENGSPAVEFVIEVPLGVRGINAPFKGRIDLLVEDHEYGGLWVRDAKWVKSLPDPDERMMSPQNIMYVWALRKLGYNVRGFIYDYGRTKVPTEPYILKNGTVTTRKNLDSDVATYLKTMVKAHGKREAAALAKSYYRDKLLELKAREPLWYRRERIPVEGPRVSKGLREFVGAIREIQRRNYKNPIRSYDFTCSRSCDYHELCVSEFYGLDIDNLVKSRYEISEERYGQENQ